MSHQLALQCLDLAGEHRALREIFQILVYVCIDIYLLFSSLRSAPRYRYLLQEVFLMAYSIEMWLEDLSDVFDDSSLLAIIYGRLAGIPFAKYSVLKKYVDECVRRTQSQGLLYQTMQSRIWDLALVLGQFRRRLDDLTDPMDETPEKANIAARIASLTRNVDHLLLVTGQLVSRLSHRNSSLEAHLRTYLSKPSITLTDSQIIVIKTRCKDVSRNIGALQEDLKEHEELAKWNLDRLSAPFEPTEVRASDFFGVLRNVEFLGDSKKRGTSAVIGGRIIKLKQWFTRVVGTRRVTTIDA